MKQLLAILAAIGLLVSAAELTDAEWAAMKQAAKERPRPIIYDNDGDDFNIHEGTPTVEALMAKRTTWLSKYPVSTIVFCINGSSFQMKVPTKNGEPLFRTIAPGATHVDGVKWCIDNGIDILQLQIDYARQHGMEIFADFRFNDTHDFADKPDKPFPSFSQFKRAHPELLVSSYENKSPYGRWSSYDFTHKELRDRYAALMLEVAEKYDIDGLFIDMNRWPTIFKSVAWGAEASAEEVEMFSDFLRQVRAGTEAAGRRRGRPILLGIRCPDSAGYCKAIGFDWEGLMAEGVFDLVAPSCDMRLQPWSKSVDLCHKYGVKCYPSIDMPTFMRNPHLHARKQQPCYLARVAAAYQQGADGIYYFNMFDEWGVKFCMAPNADWLRLKDKRYYISPIALDTAAAYLRTGTTYNTMPELYLGCHSTLKAGRVLPFRLECGDDFAALRAEGVKPQLKATLVADGKPGAVHFSTNGVAWKHLSSDGELHFYEAPPEALKPGVNEILFSLPAIAYSKESVELKDFWIDVKLSPEPKLATVLQWQAESSTALMLAAGKHPWERNWVCGEWDALPGAGSVRAVLSSGGFYAEVTLYTDRIVADGAATAITALPDAARRLRIQLYGEKAHVFLDGIFCLEVPGRVITDAMNASKELVALNQQSGGVLRNSGLITVPQGGAQVRGVRVRLEKEPLP